MKDKNDIKNIDNQNGIHHKKSFSNEQNTLKEENNDETPKDGYMLSQSSRNLNHLSNLKKQILGNQKEISTTVIYQKIKTKSSFKGLTAPILTLVAGQKDLNKLKNIANSLDIKEDKNINKDDYLQVRNIPKIKQEIFENIRNEISRVDDLEKIYQDIVDIKTIPFNEICYQDNVGCLLPLSALI